MPESHRVTSTESLPLVLTVEETSHILRIGKASTYALIRSGQLKSFRFGHAIRVPRHALENFLQNCAQ